MRAEVIRCLQEGWSPEQIAGRLRIEPGAPYRLCHETIYRYVYSAEGQSAQLARLLPVVERKTRCTVLLRNNDRKARPLMNRLIHEMSPLPAEARRSITFDCGLEFVAWSELESGMGTKAWFCDPQAPWQKGSVENMNRRLRRYLPRDTAVLQQTPRSMRMTCQRLNATPRKCRGYRTPAEAFRDELRQLEAP